MLHWSLFLVLLSLADIMWATFPLAILATLMSETTGITLPLSPMGSPDFLYEDDAVELRTFQEPINLGLLEKRRYELYVEIGTPSQGFSLVVDTTLPYVAVVDSQCAYCYSADTFVTADSATFRQEEGAEVTVGNISGLLGRDKVTMRDDMEMIAANMTLLVVQQDSIDMFSRGFGALGLGLERPFKGHPNFVETMKQQGIIEKAVFAIYLGKYIEPPSISFGEWNLKRFAETKSFAYLKADTTSGLWQLELNSANWGNVSLLSAPTKAIIDSSERKMIVPKETFDLIRSLICQDIHCFGQAHTFGYVCSDIPRKLLPNITMILGDTEVNVSPDQYITVTIPRRGSKKCHVQLDWMEGSSAWHLGFPFMRSYYILFDIDNSQIGLAPALQLDEIPIVLRVLILAVGVVLLAGLIVIVFMCLGKGRLLMFWRRRKRLQPTEHFIPKVE